MKEYVLLLFLGLCSAKHFIGPSHFTLKHMMLQDMEDENDDDNSLFPTRRPILQEVPFDIFPVCPFGCQCYMRVVHCSDLGKNKSACLSIMGIILWKFFKEVNSAFP